MSTAGKSYEAWKESLKQAEAEGGEDWSEACEPEIANGLGSLELKGLSAGLLIGALLLMAGTVVLLINFKHLAWGQRTVGIVTDHRDFYNRRSSSLRAPIVNYSAPGGVYKVVGRLSVARNVYPIDKEVSVLYLPNDPSNAVIADFVQLFMIPTIVGGLGLLCLTGTSGIMFFIIRNELPATTESAYGTGLKYAPPASADNAPPASADETTSADEAQGPAALGHGGWAAEGTSPAEALTTGQSG